MESSPEFLKICCQEKKINGIYKREHVSHEGKVAYFHTVRPLQIQWSSKRKMWLIVEHLWSSDFNILSKSVSAGENPISSMWFTEIGQCQFSVAKAVTSKILI